MDVFKDVSPLYITEIYAAGEKKIRGVDSKALANAIKKAGNRDVHYFDDNKALIEKISKSAKPGDVVITLGAGNIWSVGEKILQELKKG